MFRSSSISSTRNRDVTAHHYDDHYICVSNFVYQGLDHPDYYFLARPTYEMAASNLKEIYKKQEDKEKFAEIGVSLLEDPVLMSSDRKYAIFLRQEFGHFVLHNLVTIAQIHDRDPDAIIIVFVPSRLWSDTDKLNKISQYLVKFFADNEIKYYFVKDSAEQIYNANYAGLNAKSSVHSEVSRKIQSIDHFFIYKVNNLYGVDSNTSTGSLHLGDIKYFLDKYVNAFLPVENDPPSRKIYITRRVYDSEPDAFEPRSDEPDQFGYKSNRVRIYEEDVLEKYMLSKNFEVVDFETLDRIEDQINLMASTAVLVGATGTGLTNQLFMKDQQTVIELRVEHGDARNDHWMLVEYFLMSGAKQHKYLAIDVKDKQAQTAVSKLDKIISLIDLSTKE